MRRQGYRPKVECRLAVCEMVEIRSHRQTLGALPGQIIQMIAARNQEPNLYARRQKCRWILAETRRPPFSVLDPNRTTFVGHYLDVNTTFHRSSLPPT
jgi:ATP-dependent Lon protease